MKSHLLILSLFMSTIVQAQNWAPSGATWNYQYFPMTAYGREEIKRTGDTSINSRACVVLTRTAIYQHHTGPGPNDFDIDTTVLGLEYMYEDNGKVFRFMKGGFRQLYDLNAQVGDTLVIPGENDFGPVCDSVGRIRVDSSGTATLNGFSVKYIVVHPIPSSVWAIKGPIYEWIGPVSYMFPILDTACVTDWPQLGPLRCYSDNIFGEVKFGNVPCDFVVGLAEVNASRRIGIYPNPAHDKIALSGAENIKDVIVYDMAGRLMSACQFVAGENAAEISTLPDGIYLLRVIDAKGNIAVGRFVKH
jgi:hypothetical protein